MAVDGSRFERQPRVVNADASLIGLHCIGEDAADTDAALVTNCELEAT